MSLWPKVDFEQLVTEVCKPRYGRDKLSILGGRCAENDLPEFFKHWDMVRMPFRLWEYVSEINFETDTLPQNIALLERGRIFGEGGDLMLRRSDTAAFDWRFIGPAHTEHPAGQYATRNYWEDHPEPHFHKYTERALLWGEQSGKCRTENQVAAATLNYPVMGRRVQLEYDVFTYAGVVRFVWYTGLSEWKEAEQGERND